jgi:hypothetical protein
VNPEPGLADEVGVASFDLEVEDGLVADDTGGGHELGAPAAGRVHVGTEREIARRRPSVVRLEERTASG